MEFLEYHVKQRESREEAEMSHERVFYRSTALVSHFKHLLRFSFFSRRVCGIKCAKRCFINKSNQGKQGLWKSSAFSLTPTTVALRSGEKKVVLWRGEPDPGSRTTEIF